jgi:predicted permease
LGGAPFTIIGVTPPEFFGLEIGSSLDISVPLMMQQQAMPGIRSFVDDPNNIFTIMGRLRPGTTMLQAQASLSLLYQQIVSEYASRNWWSKRGRQSWLEEKLALNSGSQGLSELRWQFSRPLLTLMIVVALVLAVACANVAGLLLARAVARRKEIAIRLALGVRRLRLVRQLLTESVLIGCIGGFLGLIFASWGTRLFLPWLSQGEIPVYLNLRPNAHVFSFTVAVAVLTGVMFGLAPAFLTTRVDLNSALKNDAPGFAAGPGSHGAHLTFGQVFVIFQVALSLLLLVGASLFVRSLQNLQRVDAGFARENLLALKLEPVGSDRKTPRLATLYDGLLRRVEAIPGVKLASLVGYSPMSRQEWLVMGQSEGIPYPISVQGYAPQQGEDMSIPWMQVYPNSFATLGISFVAGRDFGPQDNRQWIPSRLQSSGRATPPVMEVGIINESMARRFFGKESPIGRRFGIVVADGRDRSGDIEIIGVVKDVKYTSLRDEGRARFYLPFHQANTGRGQMTLVVRTTSDPMMIAATVQREARALDQAMPMFEIETIDAHVAASLHKERLLATLSSCFGLLALLLSCLGLYGVLSYAVACRTNEIGIRMALGAVRRDVFWLVLRDALRLILLGVALGIPVALAATRLVSGQLFRIGATDPLTIGSATLALLAVTVVASYLPAWRATRVDPIVALKYE